ncbi:hypothetical protein HORIV_40600 [Vreelandella olivaria]|uniref:CobN/magnesium chelatase domain-containing protein n=1 Tax=Vreelandella olivaria TaxID=390919 RepID=A0ABN5WXF8_9GAMM|nr:hypothetical protein HORIV_40600 [Halomonas olivaria]
MTALAEAGYPLSELPDSGDDLIRLLQGAVTNDHASLDQRACWQSISIDDYLAWFKTLPAELQNIVHTLGRTAG